MAIQFQRLCFSITTSTTRPWIVRFINKRLILQSRLKNFYILIDQYCFTLYTYHDSMKGQPSIRNVNYFESYWKDYWFSGKFQRTHDKSRSIHIDISNPVFAIHSDIMPHIHITTVQPKGRLPHYEINGLNIPLQVQDYQTMTDIWLLIMCVQPKS